jgi:hypothetical protein
MGLIEQRFTFGDERRICVVCAVRAALLIESCVIEDAVRELAPEARAAKVMKKAAAIARNMR